MLDHEMHLGLQVLKDCANKFDENQGLGLFQKKLELFSGKNLFPMKESYEDEDGEAINWVNECCINLIHNSTHTSISASSSENEIWEKEFSLLVQQEELEAFLGVHGDLLNAPSPSQQPHKHILLSLDAIQQHMDWVEYYMSRMEYSYGKISAHEQLKAIEKANCQEELMRKISCIRWPLWRIST